MIRKGDRVYIRPEWQDEGDDEFVWYALEDEDGGRVSIRAQLGIPFDQCQVVNVDMLQAKEGGALMLNLCANHKQEPNQSEFAPDNCDYCRMQSNLAVRWARYVSRWVAARNAVDALRQWRNAESTGDGDELRNARASRDQVLAKAEGGAK